MIALTKNEIKAIINEAKDNEENEYTYGENERYWLEYDSSMDCFYYHTTDYVYALNEDANAYLISTIGRNNYDLIKMEIE